MSEHPVADEFQWLHNWLAGRLAGWLVAGWLTLADPASINACTWQS
jgi:hypothetical protein